ncbi:type II toxin-antitoxin system death-on-curing family toxin [Lewinella sp. LCG006]|uniref:type II toxin-antitoxin system death-on-curing family toxin n=1 Tax=Lewinella sp. LCG006 TaxID=3231911 RepID=UPI0034602B4C
MITIELALGIHRVLISRYGGHQGLRDKGLLKSAIARPYQTFDGQDLYPTSVEKAAAIIESILINHPFMDGNKRTGYVLMRILLLDDRKDINAEENDKYDFVINIASGKLSYDGILKWIKERVEDKKEES